jgi:hypothetical protein
MTFILSILCALVFLRLALPYVIRFIINKALGKLDGYHGTIKKIRISLFSNTLTLGNITFDKIVPGTGESEPFLKVRSIDVSFQWKAVFNKSLVGDILMHQPELQLARHHAEATASDDTKASPKKTIDLKNQLQHLLPFHINLEIINGLIRYSDRTPRGVVDVSVTHIDVLLHDFSNMTDLALRPAALRAQAKIYGGTFDFSLKLYPLAEQPTFDMNAELKNINMVLLNGFFRAYAKIDVNRGTLGMYMEATAKYGVFTGYVKPVIRDLDIVGAEDRDDSLFRKLWEKFVAGAYQILKNKREDQFAARIPIQGRLGDPDINCIAALLSVLQNAFIRAIHPSLDDVITIAGLRKPVSTVKRFFRKNPVRKKQFDTSAHIPPAIHADGLSRDVAIGSQQKNNVRHFVRLPESAEGNK